MRFGLDYVREGRGYVIALVLLLAGTYLLLAYAGSAVGGDKTPVTVVVRRGETAESIGARLRENGLVRWGVGFAVIARLSGRASGIQPGAYRFDRTMSVPQMLDRLVNGEVAAVWITIPEGFTIRQIADRLARRGLVDRAAFLTVVNSRGRGFADIVDVPAGSLEGYLFPSTYLIPLDASPREIVSEMLRAFRSKVMSPLSRDIADAAANPGTRSKPEVLYDVIIVASMIEREAKIPRDCGLISAVIWNRLRRGMKLEVDATVQYARGEHRGRLYYEDLRVESPYNTYLHPGLPPGPIANPGLASIRAALHPARVDYLYYVARPDGSHIFSRTLAEHNAAKQRVRSGA